jgi:hypothetical protein
MTSPPATDFEYVDDLTGFRAPGWQVMRLKGRLRRKDDLFRALEAELKLPGYFGWNWDSLEECLRDLSWLGADARVVLLHEQLPLADASQRQTYVQILHAARTTKSGSLRVIFPQGAHTFLS